MTADAQALTTYGSEKLSLSDAQELLSQIEPDENGLINYVEFVNMSTPRPTCAQREPSPCLVYVPRADDVHGRAFSPDARSDVELTLLSFPWSPDVHVG